MYSASGFSQVRDIKEPIEWPGDGIINDGDVHVHWGQIPSSSAEHSLFSINKPNKYGLDIKEVFHSSWMESRSLFQRYVCWSRMDHSSPDDLQHVLNHQPVMQFHSPVPKDDIPTFRVSSGKVFRYNLLTASSIDHFDHLFRDSLYADELWSSAVNKELTDIDFQVSGKIISAHRALLAARCPTLLPQESSSMPMAITNVDPIVFEELLSFIYTGMVKTWPPTEQLYLIAVTYQVDTLMRIFESISLLNCFKN